MGSVIELAGSFLQVPARPEAARGKQTHVTECLRAGMALSVWV